MPVTLQLFEVQQFFTVRSGAVVEADVSYYVGFVPVRAAELAFALLDLFVDGRL